MPVTGVAMIIAGLIVLNQTHTGLILMASAILMGLGLGTIISSGQAIAIKLAPPHHAGLATSNFFSILDAGVAIGPYIFGLFVPMAGYSGIYMMAAGLGLIGLFLYYLLQGRNTVKIKQ